MKILLICTGNTCRSQMAEGYLKSLDPRLEVFSAGTRAELRVNPNAVKVMKEIGIDISGYHPKSVDLFLNYSFDFVITVCGGAKEVCPVFTGKVKRRIHIGFDDPAAATGNPDEVIAVYRRVRDEIASEFGRFYRQELFRVVMASTPEDYKVAGSLFREYAGTLDFDLCFQDFESELEQLETMYSSPEGSILLIYDQTSGEFVGCAGIRRIDEKTAELKRMYLRDAFRNRGLGETLLDRCIDTARELGYLTIRLDTMAEMTEAIRLYRKKGFSEIGPYRYNPSGKAVFFELQL